MKTIFCKQLKNVDFCISKSFCLCFILCFFMLNENSFSQRRIPLRNKNVWKTSSDTIQKLNTLAVNKIDTADAQHLQEVIISATRTEKKIDEVGRSVTVISNDDIQKSGAQSVGELLSAYEGIYVVGSGQNPGTNQSIFMRGANSNQSVIMIDGIAITDPSSPNGAIDISELSLSDVDKIEIVRGSHSTLYGSSAIGGVVNIITNKKMKDGINISADGKAGTFGKGTSETAESIFLNYSCPKGGYLNMNINSQNDNGLDATIDTATSAPFKIHDKDNYNMLDAGGKAGFKNEKWDLFYHYKIIEMETDIDDGAYKNDDNYKLKFDRNWSTYGISYKADSGFSVSLKGGFSAFNQFAVDDSSVIDTKGNTDKTFSESTHSGTTLNNEIQFSFSRKKICFVFGGGENEQTMNQKYYYYSNKWGPFTYQSDYDSLNLVSRTNNFFLLADVKGDMFWKNLKALSVLFGARSSINNTFGSNITYQVNPMVKISSTTNLYANLSTGYNAPSLYELHAIEKDMVSGIAMGNINLRPEKSISQELGLYQNISGQINVRVAYFKTITEDVVDFVSLWNKNTSIATLGYNDFRGSTYLNLGKLTTEGIELGIFAPVGKKISMSCNFSYIRGNQDFSMANIDTAKTKCNHVQLFNSGKFITHDIRVEGLTRRPCTANLSLIYYPVKKIFLKTNVKYVASRKDIFFNPMIGPGGAQATNSVDAYTLVDFLTGIKFSDNVSMLVRVENLFDVSYQEIMGYSTRGRGLFINFHYGF
ncbi:MAG: TonB-dependent receptor [Bacteroidota bacterium]